MNTKAELYIRNIIFGVTDSLVSTVGLLAGIDASGTSTHIVITTGIIYALVEGFSMAVGSFLSEESVEEYKIKRQVGLTNSITGGAVMFVAFVLASFIPLVPYIYLSSSLAIWGSVILSVFALFVLGVVSAKMSKISILKHGFNMAILGASAIVIGVLVGKFMRV